MKRRVIAILLIFTMLFSLTPSAFAEISYENSFSDTENHWAKTEIEKWSAKGLLMGSNGTFRPNDDIKRAEMAVIIDRIMNYQETGENIYADLDDTWYTDAILKNSTMGVIKGADGLVRPLDSMTREEAVVMLSRAFEIEKISGDTIFVDDSQVSSWSKEHIKAFSSLGYIKGKPDGTFAPRNSITRAEVVKIIDNMVAGWINESGEVTGDFDGTVIINTQGVTLKDATISNDLIITQGVAEGEVNLDNVIMEGNTFIKGGGENSVYFNDVEVKGELKVAKPDGKIRIVASGTTSIRITNLESGALLVEQELTGGGFETVIIPAKAIGNEITIQGDCKDIEINTDDITITIDKGASVEDVLITGDHVEVMVKGEVKKIDIPRGTKDIVINGSGKVEKVLTDGEGTEVTTYDTEITAGQNSKGVIVRGKSVMPGKKLNIDKKPSSGGGGSTPSPSYIELVLTALNDETAFTTGSVIALNATPTKGDGSYTYKWYSCDDTSRANPVEIVGQTNATFTPKSSIGGNYYYYGQVTETAGDNEVVNTNVMTLVIPMEIINITLELKLPELNDEIVFTTGSVIVLDATPTNGDGTYTYKWYSCDDTSKINPVEIVGQTNATFIPKSDVFGTYYYYCQVTETAGNNEVVNTNVMTMVIAANIVNIAEMLGAGTVADPFQIETIEDLVTVGKAEVIDGVNDYSLSSNYILNNNLDFTDDNSYRKLDGRDVLDVDGDGNNTELLKNALTSSDGGSGFDPIGDDTNEFTGTFDGDGYTINNLYINRSTTDHVGLFGDASNSTIGDIGLVDVDITGRDSVGGLVGENIADGIGNTAIISNSYVIGSVYGAAYVGGLVGENSADEGTATISNSYAQVAVTGTCYDIGGLVGENYAESTGTATISNSYALGDVTGNGNYVGGLAGEIYADEAGDTTTISNSYALGDVDGGNYVGGLVGENCGNEGTDTISYSIAFNSSVTSSSNAGRVVGSNNEGTGNNNYANGAMEVTGIVGGGEAGTDMTVADFSNITSTNPYSTWDFDNIWEIKTGVDRPTLIGVGDDIGSFVNYVALELAELKDKIVFINGNAATLNAIPTSGDGTYTYKWYSCDDKSKTNPVEIVDQTKATFTPKSGISGTYYYYCQVTETAGDNEVVNTNVMTLAIPVDIVITLELELPELNDETIFINGNVTELNATPTSGDGAYTYKWYSCDDKSKINPVEIVDQTKATFTPKSDIVGTYYYYCQVTETEGNNEVISTNVMTMVISVNIINGVDMLGTGTVADPFQIETIEDLVTVGKAEVIDGVNDYSLSSNYILNNNLNFTDDNSYRDPDGLDVLDVDHDGNKAELLKNALTSGDGGAGFYPIGDATNKFIGTFDGAGYTINNLYINRSTRDYVGLFGYVFNSTIEDINLVDVDITGKSYVGGLVGYNYADGIGNTATISNSYTLGTVEGEEYIGGLVGAGKAKAGGTAIISNSYAQVAITGSALYVGGLVGDNYSVRGTATIRNSYALGNVEGNSVVGGLVGYNYSDHGTATISNSYALGNVTGSGMNAGGLVGDNYSVEGIATISNSYALGVVEGNISVGGLLGNNCANESTGGTLSNSIAFNPSVTGSSKVGRVVGFNNGGTITNNYANGGMIVNGTVGTSDAGADMTVDDFSDITSTNPYNTWNFTDIWEIKTSADRPTLIGVGNDAGEISTDEINTGETSTIEMIGAGTIADPFQIKTIEDLVAVGKGEVIDGFRDYSLYSNYILNNNLDFTDDNSYRNPNGLDVLDVDNDGNNIELLKNALSSVGGGLGFDPIGAFIHKFSGIFDGDGHTISNLYINRSTENNIGLFSTVANATIKNIGLVDVDIKGHYNVGGLVGSSWAEGIDSTVTIDNSYALGDVYGASSWVGGLVGKNRVDGEGTIIISNSYTQVIATGSGNMIGGLVGENYASVGTIAISSCYALGDVTGSGIAGGLVGLNASCNKGTATISNSYALVNVEGVDYVGGLVGDNVAMGTDSTATINNCYALGDVTGSGKYIGGLVGENNFDGNTVTISNSIAFNPSVTGSSNVGRIVGSNNGGTETNNYANVSMIVTGTVGNGDAGTDMTAYQFIDSASNPYTGNWDFINTWESNSEHHRPTLIGVGNDAGKISIPEMQGAGTRDNPFQIETIEDLVAVGKAARIDDINDYSLSSSYILNNNLDFADDISYRDPGVLDVLDVDGDGNKAELLKNALTSSDTGAGFDPIGDEANPFTGTFDGNRYTISNLYINRSTEDTIGLFGSTVNSIIKNIGLTDVDIIGKHFTGGLVGNNMSNNGGIAAISNSYVLGDVTGRGVSVGGLVGNNVANEGTSKISNSYTKVVVVTGNISTFVGGLVGSNSAENGGRATISNCYALGAVDGFEWVGGLVGSNYSQRDGIVIISNCYAIGAVDGFEYVGGLVGHNYTYQSTAAISNSVAFNPSVTGVNYVDRVVGSNDGTLTNNYANSIMTVTGTGEHGNGGFGTVSDGDAGKDTNDNGFSDRTSINPYDTWNFTNTWKFKEASDRPTLQGIGDDAGL